MTQKQMIIKALRKGATLTPLSALHRFGCMKLATRISEIISRGMLEENESIVKIPKRENGKQFMTYKIARSN